MVFYPIMMVRLGQFHCPYCFRANKRLRRFDTDRTKHYHGNSDGHRCSHCEEFKKVFKHGYILKCVDDDTYKKYWLDMVKQYPAFGGWHCFGDERKAFYEINGQEFRIREESL